MFLLYFVLVIFIPMLHLGFQVLQFLFLLLSGPLYALLVSNFIFFYLFLKILDHLTILRFALSIIVRHYLDFLFLLLQLLLQLCILLRQFLHLGRLFLSN